MGQPARPLPTDGTPAALAQSAGAAASVDTAPLRATGGRTLRASWRAHAPLWLMCAPAFLLFAALVLVPLAMTFALTFYRYDPATGPIAAFQFGNYAEVLGSSYFHTIFARTFGIAALTTAICVAIGTPEAYVLSKMRDPWRSLFLLAILAPLLVSVVVRAFGWSMLLNTSGLVNQALGLVGLGPYKLEYTTFAIVIALVHVMLPFMVIPVWTALQRLDPQIENAAVSLGASALTVLRRIILPQIMPGVLSGAVIVFSLSASAFATPAIIGGRRLKVAATLAYDEFLNTLNWPLGAAVAVLLLLALVLIVVGSNTLIERRYAEAFR